MWALLWLALGLVRAADEDAPPPLRVLLGQLLARPVNRVEFRNRTCYDVHSRLVPRHDGLCLTSEVFYYDARLDRQYHQRYLYDRDMENYLSSVRPPARRFVREDYIAYLDAYRTDCTATSLCHYNYHYRPEAAAANRRLQRISYTLFCAPCDPRTALFRDVPISALNQVFIRAAFNASVAFTGAGRTNDSIRRVRFVSQQGQLGLGVTDSFAGFRIRIYCPREPTDGLYLCNLTSVTVTANSTDTDQLCERTTPGDRIRTTSMVTTRDAKIYRFTCYIATDAVGRNSSRMLEAYGRFVGNGPLGVDARTMRWELTPVLSTFFFHCANSVLYRVRGNRTEMSCAVFYNSHTYKQDEDNVDALELVHVEVEFEYGAPCRVVAARPLFNLSTTSAIACTCRGLRCDAVFNPALIKPADLAVVKVFECDEDGGERTRSYSAFCTAAFDLDGRTLRMRTAEDQARSRFMCTKVNSVMRAQCQLVERACFCCCLAGLRPCNVLGHDPLRLALDLCKTNHTEGPVNRFTHLIEELKSDLPHTAVWLRSRDVLAGLKGPTRKSLFAYVQDVQTRKLYMAGFVDVHAARFHQLLDEAWRAAAVWAAVQSVCAARWRAAQVVRGCQCGATKLRAGGSWRVCCCAPGLMGSELRRGALYRPRRVAEMARRRTRNAKADDSVASAWLGYRERVHATWWRADAHRFLWQAAAEPRAPRHWP